MRHVQPAFRGENQNLVAYQDGQEIYFLTVRQVDRDEEKYRKVFVPKDPSTEAKLNVEVGFDVIDIVEINEPKVFYMFN